MRKPDNTLAKNHEDNLDTLRACHFKDICDYTVNYSNNEPRVQTLPQELDDFLTMPLLNKAINEMPTGKTPGPDGIRNEVFPKQHAFTMGKSTETALSEITHMLEKAKHMKLKAIVVSIAFDTIPFDTITEALTEHGVDPSIVNWVTYLSKNRVVTTDMGGTICTFVPPWVRPRED